MEAFGKSTAAELDHLVLLLRAANMPSMLPRLKEIISDKLMDPMTEWMGGEDARLRTKLLTIFICGLMIHNISAGQAPLTDDEVPRFTAIATRFIQGLIDGTDAGLMSELGLKRSPPQMAEQSARPAKKKPLGGARGKAKEADAPAQG